MKKGIVMIALLVLVIWGVYDISKRQFQPATAVQSEQSNDRPESDLKVGLDQGNVAPDFTLTTPEGESLSLTDFLGKKVILNMWATWCPPCKEEMPHIQSFYMDHQVEGIEVLAINLTESEKNVNDVPLFISEYDLTFPVVLDLESEVAELYQITTIPTTYILNSRGQIAQKIVGPMTYEMMDDLMRQVD